MGASFALLLDSISPDSFAGIVIFYGASGADLSESKAQFQCHFAENDDWETIDDVKTMTASNAQIHTYPGAAHWFFEENMPEDYKAEAAALAWKRTVAFFSQTLSTSR